MKPYSLLLLAVLPALALAQEKDGLKPVSEETGSNIAKRHVIVDYSYGYPRYSQVYSYPRYRSSGRSYYSYPSSSRQYYSYPSTSYYSSGYRYKRALDEDNEPLPEAVEQDEDSKNGARYARHLDLEQEELDFEDEPKQLNQDPRSYYARRYRSRRAVEEDNAPLPEAVEQDEDTKDDAPCQTA